jgi:hypothetical protein
MSKRIEEIIDVLREIKSRYSKGMSRNAFQAMRHTAVKAVATVRRIEPTTVSSKFRRELRPDIDGTGDFDRTVLAWLVSNSDELQHVLMKYAIGSSDRQRIHDVFNARR